MIKEQNCYLKFCSFGAPDGACFYKITILLLNQALLNSR